MVNIKGDFLMGGHTKEVQSISITSNRSSIISFIVILILSLTTGIAVVSANESPEADRNYPDFSVTVGEGESQEFSIDVSHDDGDLGYVEWYVDGEFETSNSISGSSDTDYYTHTFDEPGNELVEAVTYTEDWESGEQISWDVTIEEEEDTVPEPWPDSPDEEVTITEGESVNFVVGAEHYDGELHGAEWYVDHSPEDVTYGLSGSWDTDDWSRTFNDPGTYTVEADVFDSDDDYNDEAAEWTVTVEEEEEVRPESWPDSPDEAVTITEGESVNFVVGAEHDDGELHGAEWYVDHSPEDVTYGLSGSWDTDDWSRTFDDPGTYTVEADVFDSDDDYNDEAAEWTVTVEEEEDTVPESWPDSPDEEVTITEGESVDFVVGAEHDDGELHGTEWYVDHSPEDVTYGLSGSWDTDDWSYTFDDPGTYTVEADVFDSDDDYNDEAAEWTVTVEEEEETVPESWPDNPDEEVTITEGESVDFVVGAEHDDGDLHGTEWYVDNSHEENTYGLSGWSDTDDWSHTFEDPGTYTVEADVFDSDDDYNHEATEWTVTVEEETSDGTPTISRNDPVTASVVVDEGDTQEFEVEVSDPDAGLESLEWYVNGENEHTGDLGDDSLQTEDWSQTFDTPDEYTIEAVVTNDEGSTDSVSWNVSATEIQHEEPILERIGSDDQVSTAEGSTVDFTVTAESDVELSGLEWRINGEIEAEQGLDGTSARESWSNQFDEPGEYQVTAVVFDEEQQHSNSVTWQVNVEPAGLTVEVINRDGTPISDAEVTLYGIGEGVTDDSGEVVFYQSIDSETRLVVDDGSEFSSEFRDVSPEEEHIVVEVTQGERIFVTIMDESGDPVSDTTVSIQGSDISGETNEIGSVTFSEELLPRRYDLSIEGYESRTIVVEPGEEAYTVETQQSEENGLIDPRTSAFSRGVVCGDPCWNAELYNQEYSMEYFAGWISASVATPFADARDLGSSVRRGDATDASLALVGVGSSATLGASAVPKSVSKVGKYLQRYPGQAPQMGRFLLESRVVPDEVFYRAMPNGDSLRAVEDDVLVRHLDEDVNPGALGRLADEGADLANARIGSQVTEADINRIAQEGRASEAQLIARAEDGSGVRWLDEGGETNGWDHISSRHVTGEAADSSTDLFPTGHQGTPQRMGEDDVKDLIYQGMTSQRGQVQTDANRIVMEASDHPQMTEYGINRMRVIVSPEGRVITAYPTQGPAVTTP